MLVPRPRNVVHLQPNPIATKKDVECQTEIIEVPPSGTRQRENTSGIGYTGWERVVRETTWDYERYTLLMLETFNESFLLFSRLELFTRLNIPKLMKPFWLFEEVPSRSSAIETTLEYDRIVPMNLYKKLSVADKFRLCERRFTDSESYEFRLLAYILHDVVVNTMDVFVIFGRKHLEQVIETLVRLKANDQTLEMVSRVLSEDYRDLQLKCHHCRHLLKCIQGVLHRGMERV
jgi:hypothetical protein